MTDPVERLSAALAGRYAIERELGTGGMATVYLAADLKHDRLVAIKTVRPDLAASLGPERFLREIRIAARLQHPHILPLYDSGASGDILFYIMPYVEGESLRDRLDRDVQLPIAEALNITRQVASALSYAHSRDVVHRDIKPENILLSSDGAMVADFGIARAITASAENRLTSSGMAIGTADYMSPEQAAAERVDGRSDIYSLGCVLYEMLAGQPPYTGPTVQAIQARRLTEPVPPLRNVRETVPAALESVIGKALARVPADRYATASRFAEALVSADVATGGAVAAQPPGTRPRFPRGLPRPGVGLTLGALVVAVGLGVGALLTRSRLTRAAGSSPVTQRIAVLPFTSLDPDPRDAYFADGITDELITTLSQVPGLSVIARTSVMGFRTGMSVADVARALNVGSVVEGSVQRSGDRARIAVSLIDARTQTARWSADYDRVVTDLLALQRDIARQVAQRLSVSVGALGSERRSVASPAAYDAFLRAQFRLRTDSRANTDSAIVFLTRATELDPDFAPAQAALAGAYAGRFFSYDSDPKWEEQAYVALGHALHLDSTLADAYLVRADLAWTEANGWQVQSALRDLRRALALQPSLVEAHNSLGSLLLHIGLLDEAARELKTARALDPLDRFAAPRVARVFWYRQQFDSAEAWFAKTRGWDDEKALVLRYLGRTREAIALLDSARSRTGGRLTTDLLSASAVLLAASGRRREAEATIREASRRREGTSHFHHAQYNIASAYALLGDHRQALEWLKNTAANGMPCYPLFAGDPNLDGLRRDPQFVTFLDQMRAQRDEYRRLVGAELPDGTAPEGRQAGSAR